MSEQVNKYLNGKIYMIKSENSEKVYIGSTVNALDYRLKQHERKMKEFNNGKYHDVSVFEILRLNEYKIELIELFPCQSKSELDKREGEIIKKYDNRVNKRIEGRKKREYVKDNEEKIKLFQKEYRKKNQKEISEKAKKKYECGCGSKIRISDKTTHVKSKKHIKYEQNKTINI